MKTFTLTTFAHFMFRAAAEEIHADQLGRRMAGERLRRGIQQKLGKERLLPPPLAISTQRERLRLGFTARDTLKRTGALQRSIEEGTLSPRSSGVGTSSPYAIYHELGGRVHGRPPKRSFMASTARSMDTALRLVYERVYFKRMGF